MSHPITIIDHSNGQILTQYSSRLSLRNYFKENGWELTKEAFKSTLKQAVSICPVFALLIDMSENINHKNEMENIYLTFYNIERILREMHSEMQQRFLGDVLNL